MQTDDFFKTSPQRDTEYSPTAELFSAKSIDIPSELTRDDSLEVLGLPMKLENALKNWDIYTIGQLHSFSEATLYKIRNLGPKSVNYLREIKRRIKEILITEPEHIDLVLTPATSGISGPNAGMTETQKIWYEPLEILNLPPQIIIVLKQRSINTVGDLYSCPRKILKKTRGLGAGSIRLLNKKIHELNLRTITSAVDNTGAPAQTDIQKPISQPEEQTEIPNNELINILLNRCGNPRLLEVIRRRYGLTNGDRETLEEVGKSFSVTRERIRQIQKNALHKMKHASSRAKKPLTEIIEKLLKQNSWIISDEEADKLVPNILGIQSYDGSAILDLISDLGWIQRYSLGDVILYSPISNFPKLESVEDSLIRILKKKRGGISAEEIVKTISMLSDVKDPDFNAQSFINRYCLLDPRVIKGDHSFSLYDNERNTGNLFSYYASGHGMTEAWVSLISQVLEDEGFPLHFTEIADKVNDKIANSSYHLEHRRAHGLLIGSERFAHTGIRGTYGLTKWGLRRESTVDLIKESIKKAGFPLHWKQIYNYVSKYKNSREVNIISLLENNRRFEGLGNGIYGLKEG